LEFGAWDLVISSSQGV